MTKKLIIVGVIGVALLLLAVFAFKPAPFGGFVRSNVEMFVNGFLVGSKTDAACIKVRDSDGAGWTYITWLNGVETVTGGSAATLDTQWSIPAACSDLEHVEGRSL